MRVPFIEVGAGAAPLIVSLPHSGTDIPEDIEATLVSPWRGRCDADWWINELYDICRVLGATTVRTAISRTVIDVNRDPSGRSLYPGQVTTSLCPTETFDGEPLYRKDCAPDEAEIARRREAYFKPFHDALGEEIARLRAAHRRIVLYDAHSIRSHIPRLFEGELPQFNIGTNSGASCDAALAKLIGSICEASGYTWVIDGRFKGGWITRHYGQPEGGVHTVQMELACRGYMAESDGSPTPETWPTRLDSQRAAPVRATLTTALKACLAFASDIAA